MIEQTIDTALMNGPGAGRTVPATFVYLGEADPLTVFIRWRGGPNGAEITWKFSRDLLYVGTHRDRWQGEGDIQVKAVGPYYFLNLSPPGHDVGFSMPKHEVKDFLRKTFELVPKEYEQILLDEQDIDEEFALMLSENE